MTRVCWHVEAWDDRSMARGGPANTRSGTNVDLMLAHRLRLWANIKSTLVLCLVYSRGGGGWVTEPRDSN